MNKDRIFFNMEKETLTGEKLLGLQLKKLNKQLKYCYDNSEFYRKRFTEAGAMPEDIKTWDDFRKLPLFFESKDDERNSRLESQERYGHPYGMHLCVPLDKIIDARTTSGTTGLPTYSYIFTKNDMDLWKEGIARIIWRAGVRSDDVGLYCLNLGIYAGGIIADLFRDCGVGAQLVETGIERGTEFVLNIMKETKPTVLFSTPSYVQYLIEKVPELTGKKVNELGIKTLITTGEPGAGLPEVKKRVEQAWGVRWYDVTAPTGTANVVSCNLDEYQGMHHVDPDISIWPQDLVDPVTKESIPVTDGAIGEGVITNLEKEACPLIRYAHGDILQVYTQKCKCGVEGIRCKIVGRADDMLIVKGVNVYPSVIKDLITSFCPRLTGELRIILEQKPPLVNPPLKIKVEYGTVTEKHQLKDLEKEIKNKMHSRLKVTPDIEFIEWGKLGRAVAKTDYFEKMY